MTGMMRSAHAFSMLLPLRFRICGGMGLGATEARWLASDAWLVLGGGAAAGGRRNAAASCTNCSSYEGGRTSRSSFSRDMSASVRPEARPATSTRPHEMAK